MVTTSRWPVTVDGVRLDTLAYNIETRMGRDSTAVVVGDDVDTEMRHGHMWTAHKKYGPGRLVLRMWVGGTTVDGDYASIDDYALYRSNLDYLNRLFSPHHRLLDVRQTVDNSGPVQRQALCELITVIDPETVASNPYTAKFTVELKVPNAFWTDIGDTNWTSGAAYVSATVKDLVEFQPNTAPMIDLYLVVDGPATNPKVFDNRSGHWVQYNGVIPNLQQWVVNTSTWSSKVGTGIEFTDTGLDVYAQTDFAGGHSPRLFGIVPDLTSPQARMEGTGFGANTRFRIRAKRQYL